jgi:peptidoglycan/LPS O-acetylase OafA/YrhL
MHARKNRAPETNEEAPVSTHGAFDRREVPALTGLRFVAAFSVQVFQVRSTGRRRKSIVSIEPRCEAIYILAALFFPNLSLS